MSISVSEWNEVAAIFAAHCKDHKWLHDQPLEVFDLS